MVLVIAAVFRLARTSQQGVGGGVCSFFLSILLRFLLVQVYIISFLQFWNQVIFFIIV